MLGEWNGFVGGESIAFVSSGVLFGYNNEDTGFDVYQFAVSSSGFQVVADVENLLSGFDTTITAQGGWVFATDGQALDASTMQPAGQYAANGSVWPSDDGENVWFLTDEPALVDFGRTTFLQTQSVALPMDIGSGTPTSLVGWSATSFAFRTDTTVCVVNNGP